MNMDQLEALEAIVETGSFRAAAIQLKKTQSTLSLAIKNLEAELKIKIFDRTEYRPQLTEKGKVIFREAGLTLKAARNLKRISKEIGRKKIEKQIIIGVDPMIAASTLTPIIETCLRVSDTTKLAFRHCLLTDCEFDLQSEVVEFVIAPTLFLTKNVDYLPIGNGKLITAVSRSIYNSFEGNEKKLTESLPQILVYHPANANDQVDTLGKMECSSVDGRQILVTDHSLKFQLIENGLGWGRIGVHELNNMRAEKLIELKNIPQAFLDFDLCLMRKSIRPLGPVGQAIWNYYLDLSNNQELNNPTVTKNKKINKIKTY